MDMRGGASRKSKDHQGTKKRKNNLFKTHAHKIRKKIVVKTALRKKQNETISFFATSNETFYHSHFSNVQIFATLALVPSAFSTVRP